MSKRSDVTLILSKQVYENMKKELSKEKYNNDGNFYGLELITKDVDKKIENNNFVSLRWTYIKWNVFFEDVSSIEDYLSSLKEEYIKRLDNNEEITDEEILDKYAFELLRIGEDGTSDFFCYNEDGYENDVYLMPGLYNDIKIFNEMEENKHYVVNELVILTDNQFEIYNVCHLITKNKQEAIKLGEKLILQGIKDLDLEEEDINKYETNNQIHYECSSLDGYNTIEINIDIL